MMLIVWLVVGIGALLLLAVLAYGLLGHAKRLRDARSQAQSAVAPQLEELSQGIRRAQSLRMPDAGRRGASPPVRSAGIDAADTTQGRGRDA